MDPLGIIVQQVQGIFTLYLSQHVNTGTRQNDNYITTLMVTLFTVSVGFLVAAFKGDWRFYAGKLGLITLHPTVFNASKVQVPKDSKYSHVLESRLDMAPFCLWMYKYNLDKIQSHLLLSNSLDMPTFSKKVYSSTSIEDSSKFYMVANSISHSLTTKTPVWCGSDGHFVFAVKGADFLTGNAASLVDLDSLTISIVSDSLTALQ